MLLYLTILFLFYLKYYILVYFMSPWLITFHSILPYLMLLYLTVADAHALIRSTDQSIKYAMLLYGEYLSVGFKQGSVTNFWPLKEFIAKCKLLLVLIVLTWVLSPWVKKYKDGKSARADLWDQEKWTVCDSIQHISHEEVDELVKDNWQITQKEFAIKLGIS